MKIKWPKSNNLYPSFSFWGHSEIFCGDLCVLSMLVFMRMVLFGLYLLGVFDTFDFIVVCIFYLLPGSLRGWVWHDETVIVIHSWFLQHIHFMGLTCLICIISTCTPNNSSSSVIFSFSCSYSCITIVCFLYMKYPLSLSVSLQCAWWAWLRGCCGHHPFYVRVHKSWANLGWINDSMTTVMRLIIWIAIVRFSIQAKSQ